MVPLAILSLGIVMSSCKKDEMEGPARTPAMQTASYNYEFNNGQVVPTAAYSGTHKDKLSATVKVDEISSTQSMITVTLNNSISGQTYNIHSHDAADPTTPNGTPYNETPNTGLLTMMINGTGGMVMGSQMSAMSYTDITSNYSGFLVVHDPLQPIDTTNPATYLLLGLFAQ